MSLSSAMSAHVVLEAAIDDVLAALETLEPDESADKDLDEIMSAITAASGDLEIWIKEQLTK